MIAKNKLDTQYFTGKYPLRWIDSVIRLPGKTAAVALVLLYSHKVNRSDLVRVSPSLLRKFGVHRSVCVQAISRMEAAGLLQIVDRKRGRCPTVLLLKHRFDEMQGG